MFFKKIIRTKMFVVESTYLRENILKIVMELKHYKVLLILSIPKKLLTVGAQINYLVIFS